MKSVYDTYDYPRWWKGREFEHKSESLAITRLLSSIEKRKSIIDIGAGFGRLVPVYSHFFSKITLFDPSKNLLLIAEDYLEGMHGLNFVQGEVENLPFPTNTFDIALCVRLIHHFNDPNILIAEASRVIKEGGFFILEFANKIHFFACLLALLKGNIRFRENLNPQERRSPQKISQGSIPFMNYHPHFIINRLAKNNFQIVQVLSVSNLRYKWIKKIMPLSILLFIEEHIQKPLASIWFGPSIFILAQKTYTT